MTRGGLDVLEVYRCLEIPEIWLWQAEQLTIYSLQGQSYQQERKSKLLPDLDLSLLAEYALDPNPRVATQNFREQVRKQLQSSSSKP